MAAAAAVTTATVFILLLSSSTSAHNITQILSGFPAFAQYNSLLSQTKVADEINSRQTITVLVLNDTVVNSALKSRPLDALKTLLSVHVLLDYFDSDKLHNLPDGSTTSTTLYQTSGVAPNRDGFVNIADAKGKVSFTSATEGSKTTAFFAREVKAEPYNISVVEISAPIEVSAAAGKGVNLTAAMENAGCKRFAAMVAETGVASDYDGAKGTGLTVFAPRDDAWEAKGMPDWAKVAEEDLQTVLRYHAAPGYYPMATLKGMKGEFATLATGGGRRFGIVPEASGEFLLLETGVDDARVVNTIVDSAPVTVFLLDNVLLPVELFGNSSAHPPSGSPSPLPAPEAPTPPGSPSPPVKQPASSPVPTPPKGPSPAPPAPSEEVPAAAPALAPADDGEPKSRGDRVSVETLPALFFGLVIGVVSMSLF
uniref:FAS1 domain-containing protein n=1 Tax=Kalanchoe fedtschenkoi TaxID=63787 RepID=A0A7N0V0R3_KALFE